MIKDVQYIKHSCYMVELTNSTLLFDYYTGTLPQMDPTKPIFAFASHVHADHFSFQLFEQLKGYSDVTYILSKDIKRKYGKKYFLTHGVDDTTYENIHFIAPNSDLTLEELTIHTLKSTDCGVAFTITADDSAIYHAGDLNWWTWNGETNEEYLEIKDAFQHEIAKVEGMHFDVAFLPLDPRQEDKFYLGFDYFMKHVDVTRVFPMHCWDDFTVIDKLLALDCSVSYRSKVQAPM